MSKPSEYPRWYPWMVATGVMAAFTVRWLHYIYPFTAPEIVKEFGVPVAVAALMSSANTIGLIIGGFLLGLLCDKIGVRLTISLAAIIVGIFTVLVGYSPSIYAAIAFFGIAGLFSWINVAIPRVAREWFPPKLYATATTYMNTGFRVAALILGPVIGAMVVSIGWRAPWIYFGIACIVLGLVAFALTRDKKEGAASSAAVKKVRMVELFKYRVLWILFVVFALFVIGASLIVSYMVMYLRQGLGYDPVTAGWLWSVYQIAGVVALYTAVPLADLLSARKIMFRKNYVALNFLIGTVLWIILAFYSKGLPTIGVAALLAAISFFGQFVALISTLVAEYFPREVAGTAAGFVTAVGHVPWILTPPLAGIILESAGWSYVWLMIAPAYLIAAVILVLVLKPPARA